MSHLVHFVDINLMPFWLITICKQNQQILVILYHAVCSFVESGMFPRLVMHSGVFYVRSRLARISNVKVNTHMAIGHVILMAS